ncbi:MAG: glycosyltransferase family 4 protein [Bacillota bacterium]
MNISIDGRAALLHRGTGIGTYTSELIKYLQIIDTENDYWILYPEGSSSDFIASPNFSFFCIPQDQPIGTSIFPHLSNMHIHHAPQNGIGLPREKQCPMVITLHDVIPLILPETCSKGYLKTFMEEMEIILKLTDLIITVSNYSKMDIHTVLGFPLSRIHVTHLAPEERYRVLDRDECRKYIQQKYNIKKDYILYVGGISPRKNIGAILNGFHLVKDKLSREYNVVITGAYGRSYDALVNRCKTLDIASDVIFPGFIPLEDLPVFYNGASLFIYPSIYEGFGLPPLEAMACGTPVICSNVTSIPEVVGDAAVLVPPHDPDCLAENIFKILEDQNYADSLSVKGLLHVSSYSWEMTARQTLEIYRTLGKI